MNIGHDLMRRFGPRRELPPDEHPRPRAADWVLAGFVLVAGGAAVAGLAVAGYRSEPGARVAVALCLTYLGGLTLFGVIRWLVTPGYDRTEIDAGDVFDHGIRRRRYFGGPPLQVALTILAMASIWVALSVSRHHRWWPRGSGTPASAPTGAAGPTSAPAPRAPTPGN